MPVFRFTNNFRERWHERCAIYGDETDSDIARVVYTAVRMDQPPLGFTLNSGDSVWHHAERGLYFVVDVSDPAMYVVITVLTDKELPGRWMHKNAEDEIREYVQKGVRAEIVPHNAATSLRLPPLSNEQAKAAVAGERSRRPDSFRDTPAQLEWVTKEHQRMVQLCTQRNQEPVLYSFLSSYREELKKERKMLRNAVNILAQKERKVTA